jgi:hypothetical protein
MTSPCTLNLYRWLIASILAINTLFLPEINFHYIQLQVRLLSQHLLLNLLLKYFYLLNRLRNSNPSILNFVLIIESLCVEITSTFYFSQLLSSLFELVFVFCSPVILTHSNNNSILKIVKQVKSWIIKHFC